MSGGRNRIYLCLARMSGQEMQYIEDAFRTNWVGPLGPNVDAFEARLGSVMGGGVIKTKSMTYLRL